MKGCPSSTPTRLAAGPGLKKRPYGKSWPLAPEIGSPVACALGDVKYATIKAIISHMPPAVKHGRGVTLESFDRLAGIS